MRRTTIAAMALALAGCVQAAPPPPPPIADGRVFDPQPPRGPGSGGPVQYRPPGGSGSGSGGPVQYDPPPNPGAACNAAAVASFRGATPDAATLGAIKARSGAKLVRTVPFGMAVTMEFQFGRLTIGLDRAGRIDTISCS
ncbi:I78 family peptidase inhibitor [Oharaeibacter diazotrophicus]|uniref:Peptidase inhibitor I78 family protein n=1 Tax=Oharaeibacter diazotrophicus TaxID=1920512 RepID=A0A4R6RI45_9HYPH|nr:I78 family peptidase inhibitor [Oharaeibacter diazotrophicus]TDP86201.1 peptidase inhibitor I78 family protein [Oharaeibacter diazotrophicus]BBE71858.1 peptidase inhibitor I78 family protein [Pleomorphomonas sp. SM30]GLS78622.1 hypothetical protein GCM10007904_39590 [Oharaeibacter diazotrophicus]